MLNFGLLHIGKNKAKITTTIHSELAGIDIRYISEIKRRLCSVNNPLHRGYDDKYDMDMSSTVDESDLGFLRDYFVYGTVPPKFQT